MTFPSLLGVSFPGLYQYTATGPDALCQANSEPDEQGGKFNYRRSILDASFDNTEYPYAGRSVSLGRAAIPLAISDLSISTDTSNVEPICIDNPAAWVPTKTNGEDNLGSGYYGYINVNPAGAGATPKVSILGNINTALTDGSQSAKIRHYAGWLIASGITTNFSVQFQYSRPWASGTWTTWHTESVSTANGANQAIRIPVLSLAASDVPRMTVRAVMSTSSAVAQAIHCVDEMSIFYGKMFYFKKNEGTEHRLGGNLPGVRGPRPAYNAAKTYPLYAMFNNTLTYALTNAYGARHVVGGGKVMGPYIQTSYPVGLFVEENYGLGWGIEDVRASHAVIDGNTIRVTDTIGQCYGNDAAAQVTVEVSSIETNAFYITQANGNLDKVVTWAAAHGSNTPVLQLQIGHFNDLTSVGKTYSDILAGFTSGTNFTIDYTGSIAYNHNGALPSTDEYPFDKTVHNVASIFASLNMHQGGYYLAIKVSKPGGNPAAQKAIVTFSGSWTPQESAPYTVCGGYDASAAWDANALFLGGLKNEGTVNVLPGQSTGQVVNNTPKQWSGVGPHVITAAPQAAGTYRCIPNTAGAYRFMGAETSTVGASITSGPLSPIDNAPGSTSRNSTSTSKHLGARILGPGVSVYGTFSAAYSGYPDYVYNGSFTWADKTVTVNTLLVGVSKTIGSTEILNGYQALCEFTNAATVGAFVLEVSTLETNPASVNCYVTADPATHPLVISDPLMTVDENAYYDNAVYVCTGDPAAIPSVSVSLTGQNILCLCVGGTAGFIDGEWYERYFDKAIETIAAARWVPVDVDEMFAQKYIWARVSYNPATDTTSGYKYRLITKSSVPGVSDTVSYRFPLGTIANGNSVRALIGGMPNGSSVKVVAA